MNLALFFKNYFQNWNRITHLLDLTEIAPITGPQCDNNIFFS